jgi:DNA-binding CsgD family transcriptional regulator
MPRLTSAAEHLHQETVRELYTLGPLNAFAGKAARLLSRLVQADFQGTCDMDYGANRFHAVREPALDQKDQAKLDQLFFAHVGEHVISRAKDVLGGMTVILSESMGGRKGFSKSPLYHEFYRPISVRDELGMSIPAGGMQALCFFLWREGRGFDPSQKACLDLLRPHLEQAYRNTITFSNACGGVTLLEDVGEAVVRGLVLVDARGGVKEWSERARRLIQTYFPGAPAGPRTLPDPLLRWVRLHLAPRDSLSGCPSREPFKIDTPAGRLTVRLSNRQSPSEHLLIFEEQSAAPEPTVLRALGLTPREAVIASWVAQGKTNPEIATILDANVLTVKVHLLHIFAKLGVETRTAAALRIAECWQTGTA